MSGLLKIGGRVVPHTAVFSVYSQLCSRVTLGNNWGYMQYQGTRASHSQVILPFILSLQPQISWNFMELHNEEKRIYTLHIQATLQGLFLIWMMPTEMENNEEIVNIFFVSSVQVEPRLQNENLVRYRPRSKHCLRK